MSHDRQVDMFMAFGYAALLTVAAVLVLMLVIAVKENEMKKALKVESKIVASVLLLVVLMFGITTSCSLMNTPHDAVVLGGLMLLLASLTLPTYAGYMLWNKKETK